MMVVLKRGDTGENVRELQERLKKLGFYPGVVDGIFGPVTEQAVKMFQISAGITADGIAGPQTFKALDGFEKRPAEPVLRYGNTGQYVAILQKRLKKLGFDPGMVDGVFGTKTLKAVVEFQKSRRIPADGVVGPITWAELKKQPAPAAVNGRLAGVVVIDPGHGGFDPGAAYHGLREKDITLDIGLRMKAIIEKKGVKVVMTRDGDYSPGGAKDVLTDLKNRVEIANRAGATVFLSIHTNASYDPAAEGLEVYYFRGSENRRKLAKCVYNELSKTGLFGRGCKEAGFYVLRHTAMTAVLAEIGFISSPEDARLLVDADFRQKTAELYIDGVLKFLNQF